MAMLLRWQEGNKGWVFLLQARSSMMELILCSLNAKSLSRCRLILWCKVVADVSGETPTTAPFTAHTQHPSSLVSHHQSYIERGGVAASLSVVTTRTEYKFGKKSSAKDLAKDKHLGERPGS